MTDKEIIIHGINIANCHYYVPCEETGLDCILLNNLSAKCSDDKYKYCYYKQRQRLEQENAELKAELQKFKDMAKKGLDEFKDVGGCWGCGLQLQLNQDIEDIKQLKAENDRLKEELDFLKNNTYREAGYCGRKQRYCSIRWNL